MQNNNKLLILFGLGISFALVMITWTSLNIYKENEKKRIGNSLETILKINHEALLQWEKRSISFL